MKPAHSRGHGQGCLCTDDPWESHYACPWIAGEVEIRSIPMSLGRCRVCGALLDSWDDGEHMRWHEQWGHLS